MLGNSQSFLVATTIAKVVFFRVSISSMCGRGIYLCNRLANTPRHNPLLPRHSLPHDLSLLDRGKALHPVVDLPNTMFLINIMSTSKSSTHTLWSISCVFLPS